MLCSTLMPPVPQVYRELERSVLELNARGLYTSARWAAEQLVGVGLDASLPSPLFPSATPGQQQQQQQGGASMSGAGGGGDPQERHPRYLLAKSQFDFKVGLRVQCFRVVSALGFGVWGFRHPRYLLAKPQFDFKVECRRASNSPPQALSPKP